MYRYFDLVEQTLTDSRELTGEAFPEKEHVEQEPLVCEVGEGDESRFTELELYTKLSESGELIYRNLQFSVLTGEYVQEEDFEKRIEACQKMLTDMEFSKTIYDTVSNCFIKSIQSSLDAYRVLVHSFRTRVDAPDKLFLLLEFGRKEQYGNYSGNWYIDLRDFSEIFSYNVSLALIDGSFSLEPDVLKRLFGFLQQLQKHKLAEQGYTGLLIDKCKLLIDKFRLRYDNEELFQSLLVSFDFMDEEFDPNKMEFKYLTGFREYIFNFFPKSKGDNLKYLENYFQQQEGEAANFTDYFAFVHYFRAVVKSVERLGKLTEDFKLLRGAQRTKFDRRSFNVSLNYLYNNWVSLWCKSNHPDLDEINVKFDLIKDIQLTTNIKNYFPYFKLGRCYSYFLRDLLERTSPSEDDLKIAEEALPMLKSTIDYMERYLEWGERYGFLPFQPCFCECCEEVEVDGEQIAVFVASAYVIPVNYRHFSVKLQDLQSDYQRYHTMIRMHRAMTTERRRIRKDWDEEKKAMSSDLDQVRDKAEKECREASESAKEGQKNNIQILSIFTALVVFTMGSIQIFKNVETLRDAVVFMLLFAYALCLFAVVVWFLVCDNVKLNRLRIGILVVLAAGLIGSTFVVLGTWGDKKLKPEFNIQNSQMLPVGGADTSGNITFASDTTQINETVVLHRGVE